jgi:hypothetical protein
MGRCPRRIVAVSIAVAAGLVCPSAAHADKPDQFIGFSFPINFPHLVNLEVDGAYNKTFSFGLGAVKTPSITVDPSDDIAADLTNVQATARWHPWEGAFFLGLSFGWHSVHADTTQSFTVGTQSVPATIDLSVGALYATPHLGWFKVFDGGFTLGFEAGALIPFAPSTSLNTTIGDAQLQQLLDNLMQLPSYQKALSSVQNAGDELGSQILPYVAVRLGWMF